VKRARILTALALAAVISMTPSLLPTPAQATTPACPAAKVLHPTTRWQGTYCGALTEVAGSDAAGNSWPARDYYTYEPASLQPAGSRSLVVYLHGTTQTATDAALAAKWNDLADNQGFLVVYPEESDGGSAGFDTSGGGASRAWAWGRAAYEARGNGEMETIARITRKVMSDYGVDPKRVFISGLSAGGIMTTVMAATYPDLYDGAAIWAGCSYLCSDANGDLGHARMADQARLVPAILFAGSTDYLVNPALSEEAVTGWTGMNDLADDGVANQTVSRQATEGPTTYDADSSNLQLAPNTGPDDGSRGDLGTCIYAYPDAHGNNPCPGDTLGWETYPHTVTKFADNNGSCAPGTRPATLPESCVAVESWFIHGVSHNYTGGSTEGTFADPLGPDTTLAAWTFFNAHGSAIVAPGTDVPELPVLPLGFVFGVATLMAVVALTRRNRGSLEALEVLRVAQ
jgi:poly(hydroxyalkanoate) depolymerase family esterase